MPARPFAALALVAALGLPGTALAQGVEADLRSLDPGNAEGYVRPLAEGLAHAVSSGFTDGARPLARLRWNVGLRMVGALFQEEHASFQAVLPSSITWNGTTYSNPYEVAGGAATTPTAVGIGEGVVLRPRRGSEYESDLLLSGESVSGAVQLPDGFDLPVAPFVVLEGAMGLGAGTQVSARFLPPVEVSGDVGSAQALGLALVHSLGRYIPSPLPLDISALAGYQTLSVGDYLDTSATTLGVVASRRVGPLVLFGHGAFSSATTDVEYVALNPDGNPALPENGTVVSMSFDPGGQVRVGLGATLDLTALQISGEYTLADYNTFSLKLGLGLR